MKRALACILIVSLGAPIAASAQLRPTPSRLPQPRRPRPGGDRVPRNGWETSERSRWDRQLQKCLNDRRQSRREQRICANMGMPTPP